MLTETVIVLFAGSMQAAITLERIQALKRTHGSYSIARPWTFLAGVIAIIGLVILLCFVHKRLAKRQEATAAKDFGGNAERYGLTAAERRLLMTVARLSGISDTYLIFSTQDAYCRGAAKLMQERYSAGDSIEDRHQLREAIELIHRKLGFVASSEATPRAALGPSSRQIPAGRQVLVLAGDPGSLRQAEATVIATNDDGLTVALDEKSKIAPEMGDRIRIRYSFGTSTWEFESTVTGLSGSEVSLRHSDLARFANRRRFLRVPAQGKAMVARYSFELEENDIVSALPGFVQADVTEIAGPGLRIRTSLETSIGERLLVIVSLENVQILRGIAEVKHVTTDSEGCSAAIELVTMNDDEVSTLVRLTNQAAKKLESREPASIESGSTAVGKA